MLIIALHIDNDVRKPQLQLHQTRHFGNDHNHNVSVLVIIVCSLFTVCLAVL